MFTEQHCVLLILQVVPKPDGSETGEVGREERWRIWGFVCSGAMKNLYRERLRDNVYHVDDIFQKFVLPMHLLFHILYMSYSISSLCFDTCFCSLLSVPVHPAASMRKDL